MSLSERSKRMIPFGIALTLLVGCAEAPASDLPPAGTTNTPADMVTDPALNMPPNPNPTVITNW